MRGYWIYFPFLYCTIGAKDPPKPAVPIVRCCPELLSLAGPILAFEWSNKTGVIPSLRTSKTQMRGFPWQKCRDRDEERRGLHHKNWIKSESIGVIDLNAGGIDIERTRNLFLIHNSVLLNRFLFSWASRLGFETPDDTLRQVGVFVYRQKNQR